MWTWVQVPVECGLLVFFRNTIAPLEESDLLKLVDDYEQQSKQIKYDAYKLAWYMRGAFSYEDVMYKISQEDKEIIGKIAEENIKLTTDAKMPLI